MKWKPNVSRAEVLLADHTLWQVLRHYVFPQPVMKTTLGVCLLYPKFKILFKRLFKFKAFLNDFSFIFVTCYFVYMRILNTVVWEYAFSKNLTSRSRKYVKGKRNILDGRKLRVSVPEGVYILVLSLLSDNTE